jgi:hypothetical protein
MVPPELLPLLALFPAANTSEAPTTKIRHRNHSLFFIFQSSYEKYFHRHRPASDGGKRVLQGRESPEDRVFGGLP